MQNLQYQLHPRNIDELVDGVLQAHDLMPAMCIYNIFLSLQQSMVGILETKGDNGYKLKHMAKDKMRKAGTLPISITCPRETIEEAEAFLEEMEGQFPKNEHPTVGEQLASYGVEASQEEEDEDDEDDDAEGDAEDPFYLEEAYEAENHLDDDLRTTVIRDI